MRRLLEWLYRRLGVGYLALFVVFDVISAGVVTIATLGMFALYIDVEAAEFLRVIIVAEVAVAIALTWTMVRGLKLARPIIAWQRRRDGEPRALAAWRAAVEMPRSLVLGAGWQPFVLVGGPVSAYAAIELDLPAYSGVILFAGALVSIAYASVLNFFATELFLRPVVREIVTELPPDFAATPTGIPLRWKLLGSLPLINVITGVVVAGLSDTGRASVQELGVDVVVAVIVAFTISLELTLLVTHSVLAPVRDLLDATERARKGDLTARVPVVSGDEMGALASSFNSMLRGLEERAALQEALGSYVDPGVAKRVLEEGIALEGEEVEATVMFVDIRDFTSFADGATAKQAVARLKEFFGLVVPIVASHGGHANKFIGDGLLAVFGTPERVPDHAERALAAACEIAATVERTYGDELRIGIGINSGRVMAGSIGGGGRLEYTVIGDPVNVAARVEDQAASSGETILLTEATRRLLRRSAKAVEARGSVPLRGKQEPVPIFTPGVRLRTPGAESAQLAKRDSSSAREGSTL